MTEDNALNLGDFIHDWQIDIKNKAARHKSGLTMRHLMDNEDGTFRIEFLNLLQWEDAQLAQKKDRETIRQTTETLFNQFGLIYLKKIKPAINR